MSSIARRLTYYLKRKKTMELLKNRYIILDPIILESVKELVNNPEEQRYYIIAVNNTVFSAAKAIKDDVNQETVRILNKTDEVIPLKV